MLESEDAKAMNTIQQEQVKPHAKGESYTDEGMLVSILSKMSWNMIRLQKNK